LQRDKLRDRRIHLKATFIRAQPAQKVAFKSRLWILLRRSPFRRNPSGRTLRFAEFTLSPSTTLRVNFAEGFRMTWRYKYVAHPLLTFGVRFCIFPTRHCRLFQFGICPCSLLPQSVLDPYNENCSTMLDTCSFRVCSYCFCSGQRIGAT